MGSFLSSSYPCFIIILIFTLNLILKYIALLSWPLQLNHSKIKDFRKLFLYFEDLIVVKFKIIDAANIHLILQRPRSRRKGHKAPPLKEYNRNLKSSYRVSFSKIAAILKIVLLFPDSSDDAPGISARGCRLQ